MSQLCCFCRIEIAPERRDVYHEITGFEKPGRGAGGQSGSSIVLRKRTGAIAHNACIERAKLGLHIEQGQLWSD